MALHVPVMIGEAVRLLAPALGPGGCLVDCTVGLGGHSAAFLEQFSECRLVAIDRDPRALQLAAERLSRFDRRVQWIRSRFGELQERLAEQGISKVNGIFADLGVSSMQLDEAERGFSFQQDGPLDMRMGRPREAEGEDGEELTARDIVNSYPEDELAMIFKEFGEERQARRIAREIVRERQNRPLETTGELSRLVERMIGGRPAPRRHGRPGRQVHPATRVFQALRIEVNQELAELKQLLDQAIRLLDQDGRLVVISYHSLEDRLVKHSFRQQAVGEKDPVTGRPRAETQVIEVLTKRPLRPRDEEVAANPRSRSARLRAARRI